MLRAYFTDDAVDAMCLMDDPLFLTAYGGSAAGCQHALRIMLSNDALEIVWTRIFDPLRQSADGGLKYGVLCRDRDGNAYYLENHRNPMFADFARAVNCGRGVSRWLREHGQAPDAHVTVIFTTEEDVLGRGEAHTVMGVGTVDGEGECEDVTIHYIWAGYFTRKKEAAK